MSGFLVRLKVPGVKSGVSVGLSGRVRQRTKGEFEKELTTSPPVSTRRVFLHLPTSLPEFFRIE